MQAWPIALQGKDVIGIAQVNPGCVSLSQRDIWGKINLN